MLRPCTALPDPCGRRWVPHSLCSGLVRCGGAGGPGGGAASAAGAAHTAAAQAGGGSSAGGSSQEGDWASSTARANYSKVLSCCTEASLAVAMRRGCGGSWRAVRGRWSAASGATACGGGGRVRGRAGGRDTLHEGGGHIRTVGIRAVRNDRATHEDTNGGGVGLRRLCWPPRDPAAEGIAAVRSWGVARLGSWGTGREHRPAGCTGAARHAAGGAHNLRC